MKIKRVYSKKNSKKKKLIKNNNKTNIFNNYLKDESVKKVTLSLFSNNKLSNRMHTKFRVNSPSASYEKNKINFFKNLKDNSSILKTESKSKEKIKSPRIKIINSNTSIHSRNKTEILITTNMLKTIQIKGEDLNFKCQDKYLNKDSNKIFSSCSNLKINEG